MSDKETHVIAYNGQEYEVIELGSHPHAHGSTHGHEGDNETFARYRCFECGESVMADDIDEARTKLKNTECN